VRLEPHGRGKHNLDLLASGKGRHAEVRRVLGLETAVAKVLLDVLAAEGTDVQAGSLRNSGIACFVEATRRAAPPLIE
jgi:hypothetical protein